LTGTRARRSKVFGITLPFASDRALILTVTDATLGVIFIGQSWRSAGTLAVMMHGRLSDGTEEDGWESQIGRPADFLSNGGGPRTREVWNCKKGHSVVIIEVQATNDPSIITAL
jgi:hypothetical protein